MAYTRRMTRWVLRAGLALCISGSSAMEWPSHDPDRHGYQEPLGGGAGRDGYGGDPGDPWCRRCIVKQRAADGGDEDHPAICCPYGVVPEKPARAEYRSMCQYLAWFPSPDSCLAACGEACTAHSLCGDDIECDPNPCYSCAVAPAPTQRPTQLTASLRAAGRVDLSWSDNSTAEAGHRVYRAVGKGTSEVLTESSADVVTATDVTVTGAAWYTYKVTSFGASQESASSNEARVYSAAPPSAPYARVPVPSGCVAVRPRFEWKPLKEASGYRVEVFEAEADPASDAPVLIGTSSSASYEPSGDVLKTGQMYRWRVKAMNGPLSGPYSPLRYATTGCTPD
jgi:hypothetical protein